MQGGVSLRVQLVGDSVYQVEWIKEPYMGIDDGCENPFITNNL